MKRWDPDPELALEFADPVPLELGVKEQGERFGEVLLQDGWEV